MSDEVRLSYYELMFLSQAYHLFFKISVFLVCLSLYNTHSINIQYKYTHTYIYTHTIYI